MMNSFGFQCTPKLVSSKTSALHTPVTARYNLQIGHQNEIYISYIESRINLTLVTFDGVEAIKDVVAKYDYENFSLNSYTDTHQSIIDRFGEFHLAFHDGRGRYDDQDPVYVVTKNAEQWVKTLISDGVSSGTENYDFSKSINFGLYLEFIEDGNGMYAFYDVVMELDHEIYLPIIMR